MKKIAAILSVTILVFASCEKKDVSPAPSTGTSTVNDPVTVEYRIYASSGQFTFSYTQPDASGKTETVTGEVLKPQQSFFINWTKNQLLSVKAKNLEPSASEVVVEIYADGNFIAGATANKSGAWASAEGIAK